MSLVTFFAVETMFIVNSRTGVMDIFLVFLVLATFLVALRAEGGRQVILCSVLLGLAIAIKWAAFPVAVPAGYVLWRKGLLRQFLEGLWISAVIYVAVVYVGALISVTANPVEAWLWTWGWHLKAATKISAAIPHGWASPWWSWPIMLRPIRYLLRGERGWPVAGGHAYREPPDLVVRHAGRPGRHLRPGTQGPFQDTLGRRPDDT